MPFPPRPVDSTLHGVVDYTAGTIIMTMVPGWGGVEGTRSARQIRAAAAIHAGYSVLTDYPLGAVKVIPFKVHLALDTAWALAVGALPFATGQYKKGPRQWATHVALAAFELSSLVITDPTGKGDFHGDVEAVRAANTEDPQRKIHEGPPAVRPRTPA